METCSRVLQPCRRLPLLFAFLTSCKGGLRFYSNLIDVPIETLRLIWKFVMKKVSIRNINKSFFTFLI
jgi:hypothetical protein